MTDVTDEANIEPQKEPASDPAKDPASDPATPPAKEPGPIGGRPGKRSSIRANTKEELDARIKMVGDMWFLQKKTKGDIKRAVIAEFGVTPRTVETYIRIAKKRFVNETNELVDVWRAKFIRQFDEIYESTKDEKPLAAIRALENMVKLIGADAPTKISITDPSGTKPGEVKVKHEHEIAAELTPYLTLLSRHGAIAAAGAVFAIGANGGGNGTSNGPNGGGQAGTVIDGTIQGGIIDAVATTNRGESVPAIATTITQPAPTVAQPEVIDLGIARPDHARDGEDREALPRNDPQ